MSKKESVISKALLSLGSLPNLKGFRYVKKGILYCLKDPESISNLSKAVYPKVAEEYKTTPAAVERAARHMIRTSWDRRDKDLAVEIFGNTLQSDSDVPSNALYISALAEYLKDGEE